MCIFLWELPNSDCFLHVSWVIIFKPRSIDCIITSDLRIILLQLNETHEWALIWFVPFASFLHLEGDCLEAIATLRDCWYVKKWFLPGRVTLESCGGRKIFGDLIHENPCQIRVVYCHIVRCISKPIWSPLYHSITNGRRYFFFVDLEKKPPQYFPYLIGDAVLDGKKSVENRGKNVPRNPSRPRETRQCKKYSLEQSKLTRKWKKRFRENWSVENNARDPLLLSGTVTGYSGYVEKAQKKLMS